ncbi:methyltransferase [Nocardia farcinica]|nr:methyltransferase [Nocardia farcinica]
MGKMTKQQEKLHAEALALVDLDRDLTEDEKSFVLDNFQEMSTAANSTHGAFFTPAGLAQDFSVELTGLFGRFIDLGAGIGRLSHGCRNRWAGDPEREFVCVERNPDYVRVGRKILPEATWICGDILDVPDMGLGWFDVAIGNPPFGAIKRSKNAPGCTSRKFEYHVIAVAAQVADCGVFIIPQMSAPFDYSGKPFYQDGTGGREYDKFVRETGIVLEPNCGIDTSSHQEDWHGVSPATEIVTVDFAACNLAVAPAGVTGELVQQIGLFEAAA